MIPFFITYAVYDHPKDYPDRFVVRKWYSIGKRQFPNPLLFMEDTNLEPIEKKLTEMGLIKHIPQGGDPVIIQEWL